MGSGNGKAYFVFLFLFYLLVLEVQILSKPIIALMYDFDKTLSPKDMQEYGFISDLGVSVSEFWEKTNEFSIREKMDRILSYMYVMKNMSEELERPIKRDDLKKLGENIEFFPGVVEWFENINSYGDAKGVQIEHYIISSGLQEIIEGTRISRYFKEIYACKYIYNDNGEAIWPGMTVNYTAKTQFWARINKGVLDISDDDALNKSMSEDCRRVNTKNMIYFGDGMTDIPCMKLTKENGGHSIAVYNDKNKDKVEELLVENRVNYIAKADYRAGSDMEKTIKTIIDKLVVDNSLKELNRNQRESVCGR